MTYNIKYVLLVLVLTILASLGGFFLGSTLNGFKLSKISEQKNTAQQVPASAINGFFSSQAATADGVITASDASMVTLKNNKGEIKQFPVAKNLLTIYGYNTAKTKNATSTPRLKEIVLNKPVLVNLGLIDKQYQIVSITYLPTTNSQR